MVVFLVIVLNIWRPKKNFSSISCSILFKIRDSSLLPSSHSCFWIVRILFNYLEQIQESSQFVIWSPSIQVYSFSAFSYHSPILPVLRLSDPQSARDLFVLLYLNSLKLLHSFANSYLVFLFLLIVLFNFYGGSLKISSLVVILILSLFFYPTGDLLKTFSSWRYIYHNPFYENK